MIEKLSKEIPLTVEENMALMDYPGHAEFRYPNKAELTDKINELITEVNALTKWSEG